MSTGKDKELVSSEPDSVTHLARNRAWWKPSGPNGNFMD